MKERLTPRKVAHLLLVLALLTVLFTYRTWFTAGQAMPPEATQDQICDLSRGSCTARPDNDAAQVWISALPVRAEHPFIIELAASDQRIGPVKAWLEGRDMFMGTIPVLFEPRDGGWQAEVLVGSCTSPLMVWLLTLEWSNGEKQQLALSVARS